MPLCKPLTHQKTPQMIPTDWPVRSFDGAITVIIPSLTEYRPMADRRTIPKPLKFTAVVAAHSGLELPVVESNITTKRPEAQMYVAWVAVEKHHCASLETRLRSISSDFKSNKPR